MGKTRGEEILLTAQEMREGGEGREGKRGLWWFRKGSDKQSPVEHVGFGNGKPWSGQGGNGESVMLVTRSLCKRIVFNNIQGKSILRDSKLFGRQ